MKHLKDGFAYLITISAILFTITALGSALKRKTVTPIDNCFIPAISIEYDHNCSSPADGIITSGTSCQAGQGAVGAHVFTVIFDTNKIIDENVALECGGDQVVCCVYLESDPAPCTGQPSYELNNLAADKYRISGIECKPIQF